MNGRRLFREYAKSKGKEAKSFIRINSGFYDQDTLITKDNNGFDEHTDINYKDMVHWIIKTFPNINKE
jgi:hypothetical protein